MTSAVVLCTLKRIGKIVVSSVNTFLRVVECRSVGGLLHVHNAKGEIGSRLNGFFTENGILRVIVANQFDAVGMVASFAGPITETCCSL